MHRLATLNDVLHYAVKRFKQAKLYFGHGTQNAYDEAAYLILHALHLPLDQLTPFLDIRLTTQQKNSIAKLIEQRIKQRCPAAYLTREAWLGNYKFYVDQRVIVPRSFIAELLRDGIKPWITDPKKIKSVLDLCTGSGCLAILSALTFKQAQIYASDVSADALKVARRNINDYRLQPRIKLIRSDLFKKLNNMRFDLILSNPPYVNDQSMRHLPNEYRHEPRLALAGGKDGLTIVQQILHQAKNHLTPNGLLIVEIGHNRKALERLYSKIAFTWLEVSAGDQYVFLLTRDQLP